MSKHEYNICKQDYKTLTEQWGGEIPIETIPSMNEFNAVWKPVSNYGQNNCGIFLNAENKQKLVKCLFSSNELRKPNDLVVNINRMAHFHIFPEIYRYFRIADDPKKGEIFIEMERFDGDLSDLIQYSLPRMIIKNMGLENDVIDDLIQLYETKLFSRSMLTINFTPILTYIIKTFDTIEFIKTQQDIEKIAKDAKNTNGVNG